MKGDYKRKLNENGELKHVLGFEYSYNTLKSFKKDELIELLNVAQHNYESVQTRIYNISKYAERLDKALDKAIDGPFIFNSCPIKVKDMMCRNSDKHNCHTCRRDYLLKGDEE